MLTRTKVPFEERFWSMVNKGESCWLWTGYTGKRRYGYIYRDGKYLRANRVSFEMHYGIAIPDGMVVCHTCDVTACVRPSHLFLGSHTDNMRDMVAKGRHTSQRRRNHRAKLTEDQVFEIKSLQGSAHSIAQRFGVSYSTIRRIKNGTTWKYADAN